MNVLLPGNETEERLNLIIQLTSIKSEQQIKALTRYLVDGWDEVLVIDVYNVDKSNFRRDLNKLKVKAEIVEQIKALDWVNHKVAALKVVSKVTKEL